jgi:hypothetical protein
MQISADDRQWIAEQLAAGLAEDDLAEGLLLRRARAEVRQAQTGPEPVKWLPAPKAAPDHSYTPRDN